MKGDKKLLKKCHYIRNWHQSWCAAYYQWKYAKRINQKFKSTLFSEKIVKYSQSAFHTSFLLNAHDRWAV